MPPSKSRPKGGSKEAKDKCPECGGEKLAKHPLCPTCSKKPTFHLVAIANRCKDDWAVNLAVYRRQANQSDQGVKAKVTVFEEGQDSSEIEIEASGGTHHAPFTRKHRELRFAVSQVEDGGRAINPNVHTEPLRLAGQTSERLLRCPEPDATLPPLGNFCRGWQAGKGRIWLVVLLFGILLYNTITTFPLRFWLGPITAIVCIAAVVFERSGKKLGWAWFDQIISGISQFVLDRTVLVGCSIAALTSSHFIIAGIGKRNVPWLFLGLFFVVTIAIALAAIRYRYATRENRQAGEVRFGFWAGRSTRVFTSDNVSANFLLAVASTLWLLTFFQGWPTWGSDLAAVNHGIVQFAHSHGWIGGAEIESLPPLYLKSPWWGISAVLISLLALVDLLLSRRDEVGAWFGKVKDGILRRHPELVAVSPEAATQTAPTPAAVAAGEARTAQAGFVSDLLAAATVQGVDKLVTAATRAAKKAT